MNHEKLGIFILRFFLSLFLVLWGIDKLVAPIDTQSIFQHFYLSDISITTVYVFGWIQIVFGLIMLLGLFKTYTYFIAILIHGVSTLSTWKLLINPFGAHHLFIAALPVLAGYVALFLLRKQDTLLSLGK